MALLLLAAAAPLPCSAVLCDSFVSQAQCERTVTSSGGCSWDGATLSCFTDPAKILPAGVVAIAEVGDLPPVVKPLPLALEESVPGAEGRVAEGTG